MSQASEVSFIQKAVIFLGGIIGPIFIVYTFVQDPEPVQVVKVDDAAIVERIKPLAVVEVAAEADAAVERNGEEVVALACAACHASGVLNSPKIGDAGAWVPRIAQGYETLVKHAVEDIRTMPARGGNPDLTDIEVAKAVVHMANQSGASFDEPAAN